MNIKHGNVSVSMPKKLTERPHSAAISKVKNTALQQSPKIYTGKLRTNEKENDDKMFSLLDVNLEKIARSLKTPVQYKHIDKKQAEILISSKPENNHPIKLESKAYDSKFQERPTNTPNVNLIKQARFNEEKVMSHHPPDQSNMKPRPHSSKASMNILTHDEIKEKMRKSDIFFNKKDITNKYINENIILTEPARGCYKYTSSDIFNQKDNDNVAKTKSGEQYLFRNSAKAFNCVSRSNSEWVDKTEYRNFNGITSINYNIVSPSLKKISKTKEELIKEAVGRNPFVKQKSITEYLDLNRATAVNISQEYKKQLNANANVFAQKANICTAYYDLHGKYKGLIDKPFVNK
jgi:hypothetical protein